MYLVIPLDIQPSPPGTDSIPDELDLIEAFTGRPNLTYAWNLFGLKLEVVERVIQN